MNLWKWICSFIDIPVELWIIRVEIQPSVSHQYSVQVEALLDKVLSLLNLFKLGFLSKKSIFSRIKDRKQLESDMTLKNRENAARTSGRRSIQSTRRNETDLAVSASEAPMSDSYLRTATCDSLWTMPYFSRIKLMISARVFIACKKYGSWRKKWLVHLAKCKHNPRPAEALVYVR